ncbi:Hypothetical predicted protein [Podarcis lilfordi]|nr:Hypothetical predicted protein [Podarcis lilfordi]
MADDRVTSRSPERRPVLVSSTSSSNEPTSSGLSGSLQPFFLGRTCAPSSLLSLTVPVRLDILYVLINAARGAQCLPPPAPIHDGTQASFSTCHEPPAQCTVSCCRRSACCCVPGCASGQQQPSGAAPGGYGGHRGPNGGVLEQQNYGRHWNSAAERNGGSSRSDVMNQGTSDARGKECAADWSSKEDRFATYLKNLYSDVPEKSSSEGDADLAVGTAVDPLTLDEEEQSRENVAGFP